MATATTGTGTAMQLFNAGTSGKRLNLNPIEGEAEPTGQQLTLVRLGSSVKIKQAGSDLYLTAGESGGLTWAAPGSGKTQQWTFTDTAASSGDGTPTGGLDAAANNGSGVGDSGNNGELVVGQRPSNLDYTSGNYSYQFAAYPGQCTWHCFGRAMEAAGKTITFSVNSGRDAKYWDTLVTNCDESDSPVSNSIAVFKNGKYGHVIYIEKVDGDNIYYTEANKSGKNNGAYTSQDGVVQLRSRADFEIQCGGNPTYLVL